jgi:hypothetical protein
VLSWQARIKFRLGEDEKMQNWEYLWVRLDGGTIVEVNHKSVAEKILPPNAESISAFLNRMGTVGWEAVSMSFPYMVLKRPLETP